MSITTVRIILFFIVGLALWLLGVWLRPSGLAFVLLSAGAFLLVLVWTDKPENGDQR